ncbi:MAG: hypothetical protein O2782_19640, partial [bacterium]|nr:hypothetical protein [bacterium]
FCIPSVSRWVTGEPVAGVIYVLPYLLLALPLLLPIRRPKPHGGEASVCRERWLIGSLLCLALLSAAPVLLAVGGPQNRYLVDIIPALLLLATLGGCRAWILLQFHRRVVVAAITGLCLISVLAGVSLGTFWTQYAAPYRLKTPSAWYPP